ncbi:MAG: DUF2088 domain-containing protein [Planctomycetaceae bacterium]|nr:DUF2088 domain-containing protein [Planctomycetaceae bacterium]
MSLPDRIHIVSGELTAEVMTAERLRFCGQIDFRDQNPSSVVKELLEKALEQPLGLPPLLSCCVEGDRVVIVADPETPQLPTILNHITRLFLNKTTEPVSLSIVLPPDPVDSGWQTLVNDVDPVLKDQIQIVIHDPAIEADRSYLASSAAGDRIYLNRMIPDADLLILVGPVAFDSALGYRGTTSTIFPALSDHQSIRTYNGAGHPELTPDDRRPLRDLVEEIGWLLGTQFCIQVVPDGSNGAIQVLCGAPEPVFDAAKSLVKQNWQTEFDESPETVLLSIPGTRGMAWKQLGEALQIVSELIEPGGRIICVADLDVPTGPAAELLRRSQNPEQLLKPLRRDPVADAVEISRLIRALQQARVFLFSQLDSDLVEELGMQPIQSSTELQKLLAGCEAVTVMRNANFAWATRRGR